MKSYKRLSLAEREKISQGLWKGETFVSIATRIHRPECTIGREIRRNVKKKLRSYHGAKAHERAQERAVRGRPKKMETNQRLNMYVHEKLRMEWSPEEIAQRVKLEYPRDISMRISHETIYQYLYCLPKGELKKELMKGLRHERKMRQPRINTHFKRQRIQDIVSISERPKETEGRRVPGHWEGDLIVGKGHQSAIGTLVERTTRLTLLVPLEKKDALSVKEAFEKAFTRIPKKLKKSLTYDRGTEMSAHKLFTKETGIQVYFADPYSPWQRGTNENTNGLIRQYFPKGTDFSLVPLAAIKEAERRLNERPRKTLGFFTPSEKFYELITHQKLALAI
ncbi:MAG: IS30 family transposase [Candidatus Kaiserbacteria bacterium]|nr:IS30 family transposase [Candidatus Kaiserbacteria bacterium]